MPDFADAQRPHFVGIGGAGQSALARLLLARGLPVSGSDIRPSAVTEALEREGATIYIGHDAAHVRGADWVIATDAVDQQTNPELQEAAKRDIPVWRRSRLLGWLMADKRGVAITGTHGKTTTTAMLGAILEEAGFDPTVVVGAEVRAYGGNVRVGEGALLVAEACEAYDAIHDISPSVAVITNLEADHLDHHGSLAGLVESLRRFVARLPEDGLLVLGDDEHGLAGDAKCRVIRFGPLPADLWESATGSRFTLPDVGDVELRVSGRHNVLNALAATAVAMELGAEPERIRMALKSFQGVERRLEEVGEVCGIALISDYAHHPTEIAASIQALRSRFPGRRLVIAFQPHLYSRTRDFLEAFAKALVQCDALVLTDVYPAREEPIPGISSARIAEIIEGARPELPVLYVPALRDLAGTVAPLLSAGDVFVAMGAGDVDQALGELPPLLERRQKRAKPAVTMLCGGNSAEREVSRLTGAMVGEALRTKGYDVTTADSTDLVAGGALGDVVFVALHGTSGEDGSVQGCLELLGVPYTGSGVLASSLAMDKDQAKRVLAAAGVSVLPGAIAVRTSCAPFAPFPGPWVVKPNAQGSSIGLGFACTEGELANAVRVALHYDSRVLIEPLATGTELSVCVLGNDSLETLPVVEIAPKDGGAYDYEAKYTLGATDEIIPARITSEQEREAKRVAVLSHLALGCQGFSRVDLMATKEGIFVLEVNTLPGMTRTSIFPRAAEAAGITFPDLCERILNLALEAYEARRPSF